MNDKPIKVLIVDDEPFARKYIRQMLKDDAEVEIVGEAGNGKRAVRAIEECKPSLIFLDIQMPEMDGFTMLNNIDEANLPFIIFTTAYEEYAIRAFEFHALDYLLKPFDQTRFAVALEHAKKTLRGDKAEWQQSLRIRELLEAIGAKTRFLERLLIKQNGRIVFLKMSEVDWIKADDKYIHLHSGNSRHLIRQTLHSLKSQLDPLRFVQINRSVMVNVDSIKELHTMFNGDHEVQMIDGTKFSLSRSHRNALFELLGKPIG